MMVVVTGMVGLDKRSYLEAVCRYAASCGIDVRLCNVGQMMYAEAPDVPPGKILDLPIKRLQSLRRSVFKDILARAAVEPNVLVNTHATFRWRHGLFPAVDFDQMRQLNADLYVCLLDGIAALHHRLLTEHTVEHTLKDLIVWREEEVIGTQMLCQAMDRPVAMYCLARGSSIQTIETFFRLVFDQTAKKAYLSYPMTAVVGLEQVKSQIDAFRQRMKRAFVCFDPGDLEESDLPAKASKALAAGKDFVELQVDGQLVHLSCEQIRQIERDIYSQTYARDFMLIDQSDMIISFIPPMPDGRAAISSGVERELQHAHEAAKEVYVIWPSSQRPSVFVTQTATEVFEDVDQALAAFARKGYIKDA
ncbi:MAG: AAA family ATPase [Sedimentisphaerales bacterium]|jgi:adenylate kinase|nr:AAA family ATPase [Sedimentisphaerales bacterium]